MFSIPLRPWAYGILLACLTIGTTAHAARDLGLPAPPLSSDTLRDDGSSLLTNPANATFRPGFDMGLGMNMTAKLQVGDGVYTYANFTTPFRLSIGGGAVARLSDDRGLTAFGALGWGAGPLSFALRYRVYQAVHDEMHGVSTSDIGIVFRPASFFALSAVVTNLWTPRLSNGERLEREFRLENGWRLPCGRFGAAIQWTARGDDGGYHHILGGHLDARVARGVRLFASGSGLLAEADGPLATPQNKYQVQAGLSLQTGGMSNEVAVRGLENAAGRTALGAAALFRYSSSPDAPVSYRSGGLLKVELAGDLSERPSQNLLRADSKSFTDLLMLLRDAETSPQVEGVYVHLSGLKAGVAQLWELRQALDRIRESGRRVAVYIEQGGLRDLYIAAAGDFVMASPAFFSTDAGLRVERYFLADLLQNLGIEATFVRVGAYKSAVEMFTRNAPSEAADEALSAYVGDVWEQLSKGLCENRPNSACPRGEFPFHQPISAQSLLASNWLDELGYEDELTQRLGQRFGRTYVPVRAKDLLDESVERWGKSPRIAVLHISGDIVSGKSGVNPLTGAPFTGNRTVEAAVRAIKNSSTVRGVIVRVTSPGGSAFASDEMLRAIHSLKESGLPVVVSFGDTAASGGYYVAAFPTTIFAAPTTVTGSIGIYAGTFSIDQLLQRVGVHRESEGVGGPAKFFKGRTWTEEDVAWMSASVEHGYARFTELVGASRGMSPEEVEAVAQGRIWSGKAAYANGLVDSIGGFMAAYDQLCQGLSRCSDEPYALEHFGQVLNLSLPSAMGAALRLDEDNVSATSIRASLDQLGLSEVFGTILPLLPIRSKEVRADLGGVFRVTFE